MPRQNLGDRPVSATLIDFQDDPVAYCELLRFFTFLLQSSAQRRLVRLSGFGAYMPDPTRPLQHDASFARQLLPSLRISSHQGRSPARFALISPSSLVFTSLRRISPTTARASNSLAANARNSVSRCPLATGSPWPQRTNKRYAANGRSLSPLLSLTISTLYDAPSMPSNAAGRSWTAK